MKDDIILKRKEAPAELGNYSLKDTFKEKFYKQIPMTIEDILNQDSDLKNVYMCPRGFLRKDKALYFNLFSDGVLIDVTDYKNFPKNFDELKKMFLENPIKQRDVEKKIEVRNDFKFRVWEEKQEIEEEETRKGRPKKE